LAACDEVVARPAEIIASVFVFPSPILKPVAIFSVLFAELTIGSELDPLQPPRAASKYFPVVLPGVDGVIKIFPPAGPVSPIL
jgi:hypothetical protein